MKFLEVKESLILSFKNVVQTLTQKLKNGSLVVKESLNSSKFNDKSLDELTKYIQFENITFENILSKLKYFDKHYIWNDNKTLNSIIVNTDFFIITISYNYQYINSIYRVESIDLKIEDDDFDNLISNNINATKKTIIYKDNNTISNIIDIKYT